MGANAEDRFHCRITSKMVAARPHHRARSCNTRRQLARVTCLTAYSAAGSRRQVPGCCAREGCVGRACLLSALYWQPPVGGCCNAGRGRGGRDLPATTHHHQALRPVERWYRSDSLTQGGHRHTAANQANHAPSRRRRPWRPARAGAPPSPRLLLRRRRRLGDARVLRVQVGHLAGDAAVEVQHVVDRRLKVRGRVVARADVALVTAGGGVGACLCQCLCGVGGWKRGKIKRLKGQGCRCGTPTHGLRPVCSKTHPPCPATPPSRQAPGAPLTRCRPPAARARR